MSAIEGHLPRGGSGKLSDSAKELEHPDGEKKKERKKEKESRKKDRSRKTHTHSKHPSPHETHTSPSPTPPFTSSSPSHHEEVGGKDSGKEVKEKEKGMARAPEEEEKLKNEGEEDEPPVVFVSPPPPPTYFCPIHNGLFVDPVIAGRCGHTFCRNCVEKQADHTLGENKILCPIDNTELALSQLIPNVALADCVGKILVYCRYGLKRREKREGEGEGEDVGEWERDPNGCQEQIPFNKMAEHHKSCGFRPVSCPFCGQHRISDKQLLLCDLAEHQKICDNTPCPNSRFGCDFMGTKESVKDHAKGCEYEKMKGVLQQTEQKILKLQMKSEERIQRLERHFLAELTEQRQQQTRLAEDLRAATREIAYLREMMSRYILPQGPVSTRKGNRTSIGPSSIGTSLVVHDSPQRHTKHPSHPSLRYATSSPAPPRHGYVESADEISTHEDKERSMDKVSGCRTSGFMTELDSYDASEADFDFERKSSLSGGGGGSGVPGVVVSGGKGAEETPELFMGHARMCFVGSLKGHEGPVWGLAYAGNSLVVSGSSDGTVKLWSLKTMSCLYSFVGHEGNVHTVSVRNGRIFSGSADNTIKVWDINKKLCIATLRGHTAIASSLVISDKYVFSGSYTEIKVWDLKTYQCVTTLKGHNHWVRALAIDRAPGGRLYSGSYNSISVWDLDKLECVKTVATPGGSVYCLLVSGNRLFSASYDRKIYVWDTKTMSCRKSMHGHLQTVYSLCVSGSLLYSGSYDQKIRVWSLDRLMCLQTLSKHQGSIDALLAVDDMPDYDNFIVSASADHSIYCWASSTKRVITPHETS